MVAGQVWQVVGGADRGGILVRHGRGLASPIVPGRLGCGALVTEEELVGERLRFLRLAGAGPASGWVSIRLRDRALLVPHDMAGSPSDAVEEWIAPVPKKKALSAAGPRDKWIPPASESDWQRRLTPYEYGILREGGTDAGGSHPYCEFFPEDGYFACTGCGLPLYSSAAKFKAGSAWPAYSECFYSNDVGCHVGVRNIMGQIEAHCARCKCHLGHIFDLGGITRSGQHH